MSKVVEFDWLDETPHLASGPTDVEFWHIAHPEAVEIYTLQ